MERYYFRKYKEWIKEIRNEQNLKYTPDMLTWVLLIIFLILILAVIISMFFFKTFSGKISFFISLVLLAIDTSIMVWYDGKRLIKDAFPGYAIYKGVCDELMNKFKSTFNVSKAEHYDSILNSVIEERERTRKVIEGPSEKMGKIMIAFCAPLTIALIKGDVSGVYVAISILIVLFALWGLADFYSKTMNGTLYTYDEFIGYLREIINIKKGFYNTAKEDESEDKKSKDKSKQ